MIFAKNDPMYLISEDDKGPFKLFMFQNEKYIPRIDN
jgi:hypothetical protein